MKYIIDWKNNASSLTIHLTAYLEHTLFPKLKEEYNLDSRAELFIPDNYAEYLMTEWEYRYKHYIEDAEDLIGEIANDYIDNCFIYTKFEWNITDEYMQYRIVLLKHHLEELILSNIDLSTGNINVDLIKQYLEMAMRHEIGHILHHDNLFNEIGKEKFSETLDKYDEELADYFKYIEELEENEDLSDEEILLLTSRKYYKINDEAMANKFAGVNTEEFIKLELLVKEHLDIE